MKIVVVDYGSGNLKSAAKAFDVVGQDVFSSCSTVVSDQPDDLKTADCVVLPGQGAFQDCKSGIQNKPALFDALTDFTLDKKKPFFGICVGMQLLADKSFEHGETSGFGWIDGEVIALNPEDKTLKIPHMGWNDVKLHNPDHPLFDGFEPNPHFYFVHSYKFSAANNNDVLASADYGEEVCAILAKDNMVATQFHPEKSQDTGLKLVRNFLKWSFPDE